MDMSKQYTYMYNSRHFKSNSRTGLPHDVDNICIVVQNTSFGHVHYSWCLLINDKRQSQ